MTKNDTRSVDTDRPLSEVLEAAHDYMKEYGRTVADLEDADTGKVCLIGAIGKALDLELGRECEVYESADPYVQAMGFENFIEAYKWNDCLGPSGDQKVLDRFMTAAKDLRDKGL